MTDNVGLEPTVSQDSHGGMYATFLNNDHGVQLAYSSDSGSNWSGPVTLFGIKERVSPDSLASAVNGEGQGWAVYAFQGTEYAQPFVETDARPARGSADLKLKPGTFKGSSSGGSIVKKATRAQDTSTVTYFDNGGRRRRRSRSFELEEGVQEVGTRYVQGASEAGLAQALAPIARASVFEGQLCPSGQRGLQQLRFSGRVSGHRLSLWEL